MLDFKGVSKQYDDQYALQPTDVCVEAQRTTVLIGPSGSGKSTLLRLAIGLIQTDTGRITFAGTPLTPDTLPAIRRRLGYVVQEGGLFPHFTAAENVGLMARYLGWEKSAITRRLLEVAELARLPSNLLHRYPVELSGGQRQRVSLMRALFLDPDVLLLDEPLGALDPMIRYELQRDLKDLFEQLSKSVLLVTHDIAEAAHFGHQLVLLRNGRVVQQGSFHALMSEPADPFVTQFITAQREPIRLLDEPMS